VLDPDTTVDRGARLGGVAAAAVPCVTVLWHPDVQRVGDRALLVDVAFGGVEELSRGAPTFAPRGLPATLPLGDRSISRRPLRIRGLPEGGVELTAEDPSPSTRVNGEPLRGPLRLGTEALREGVPLTLSSRVALLLHLTGPDVTSPPSLGLVGASDGIEGARALITRAASEDLPVLLVGETGTGKELAARALHEHGRRRDGPFVALNMAALPTGTAAAALFGHRRGAFTGAIDSVPGAFASADRGTLFLDEVGDTPAEVQGMLLRALETGEVQPVGGAPRRVDVRVVTALESDPCGPGHESPLRPALLHRLNGLTVRLPPLRERRDDIGRLLRHFLERAVRGTEAGARRPVAELGAWMSAARVARLATHAWPGNVRELEQVATRLVVTSWDATAPASEDPEPWSHAEVAAHTLPRARVRRAVSAAAEATPEALRRALERCDWRPTATARALGISKTTLYERMAEAGIPKAGDLEGGAIRAALDAHGEQIEAAAAALRVSPRGLLLRMRQLGLVRQPGEDR